MYSAEPTETVIPRGTGTELDGEWTIKSFIVSAFLRRTVQIVEPMRRRRLPRIENVVEAKNEIVRFKTPVTAANPAQIVPKRIR